MALAGRRESHFPAHCRAVATPILNGHGAVWVGAPIVRLVSSSLGSGISRSLTVIAHQRLQFPNRGKKSLIVWSPLTDMTFATTWLLELDYEGYL